ncbi:PH domain-containing protein [Parabacteroides sp. AM08-6]|uniref:PH domain-containing protein n=1 Tax=Parabacteroides sp. AM08-6 TaxID=2292053 RepID=UPI001314A9C2|nr:PH domain-containing protein [Parabacteroides sp. AM08-6]
MEKVVNITWSNSVKSITGICVILVLCIFYYIIKSGSFKTNLLLPTCLILILGVLAYFMTQAPTSLHLSETSLTLKKIIGKIEIPYKDIQNIEKYNFNQGDTRIVGSGGFCGYVGTFKNNTFGKYSCYVGDAQQAFLIQTKENKYYVLSCDNSISIINDIKQEIRK